MLPGVLEVVFGVLGLVVFYGVVRKAVTHGILEADEHRAERERKAQFDE